MQGEGERSVCRLCLVSVCVCVCLLSRSCYLLLPSPLPLPPSQHADEAALDAFTEERIAQLNALRLPRDPGCSLCVGSTQRLAGLSLRSSVGQRILCN